MVKVNEYELRENLYYWPKGITWAKVESDGRVRVGYTDLAQKLVEKFGKERVDEYWQKTGRKIPTSESDLPK